MPPTAHVFGQNAEFYKQNGQTAGVVVSIYFCLYVTQGLMFSSIAGRCDEQLDLTHLSCVSLRCSWSLERYLG